jgi:predicted CoA-substrate-specific enzyme activase
MEYFLGVDVGSTTVKYVVVDSNFNIVDKAYKKHNTKQAQTLLELLKQITYDIKGCFVTGSGAKPLEEPLNAKFIQEVNALSLAVEFLHPSVKTVIELGGQDAKMIFFKNRGDKKQIITSMNDKCASGTGATIEKCANKAGFNLDDLKNINFNASKLHPVAAKCGVFAETDIINLLKASIDKNEILNSLADAIVMQNLTLLARGNKIEPKVLLLGGPNKYLKFLQEAFKYRIIELWEDRGVKYDKNRINEQIFTPKNAEIYAALGAIIAGVKSENIKKYQGLQGLIDFINKKNNNNNSSYALIKNKNELNLFLKEYELAPFIPQKLTKKTKCYLGIDGGSTSSKAAIIDSEGKLIFQAYQLSKGNPIEDILELFKQIDKFDKNSYLDIKAFGVTGYAGDILEKTLFADCNIIETIAHLKGAKFYFGSNIDVICDVGGQDIKVLFLQDGNLKSFKLSNQCSAGNGAMLQSMAAQFDVELKDFAKLAFSAKRAPNFNYGCAVFLDTDRVNFQKEGYTKEELFAGIAKVLPKNIWQYIVGAPSLIGLGKTFVLQGGTQYNQAALKAQVDYIKSQINNAKVYLHPYPALAGAIGAALEAKEVVQVRKYSKFVGIKEALKLQYKTRCDASTRCNFCPINCTRTFIDTKMPSTKAVRYIAGFKCEKGTVESINELNLIKQRKKELAKKVPNLVKMEAKELFKSKITPPSLPSSNFKIKAQVKKRLFNFGPVVNFKIKRAFKRSDFDRSNIKIAIPKVLNIYAIAPFLRAYLQTLGIKEQNIIFSPNSSEKLFLKGARYGSIDPCYPAKVAQSHVYYLLNKGANFIWFGAINEIKGYVEHTLGYTACPIISGTPSVIRASFTKEEDLFKKHNTVFVDNTLTFSNIELLKEQLFNTWKDYLKITKDESDFAADFALKYQKELFKNFEQRGEKIIKEAIANKEVIILLLGRPYHLDSGINHEILDEFQALGFKVITQNSIPKNKEFLEPFFKQDLQKGLIESVFDIRDVWQENFSTNSAQKVWCAKFASRVKNIAVVDISSFKCGHDAPTYSIIENILSASKTPHLTLHDLDANKPAGSFNIRIKTFAYTLNEYKKRL